MKEENAVNSVLKPARPRPNRVQACRSAQTRRVQSSSASVTAPSRVMPEDTVSHGLLMSRARVTRGKGKPPNRVANMRSYAR